MIFRDASYVILVVKARCAGTGVANAQPDIGVLHCRSDGVSGGWVTREVVRVRDLTRVYSRGEHRVEALAGVSFGVRTGEWISVIGPSGSGKSTLMNLLGLLDKPTAGTYFLDGRDVTALRGGKLAKARRELIGFVFQSYNLLPRLSALGNVELPMVYAGVGRRRRREKALGLLGRVGLAERAHHRPAELSGGQKQRVAVARALVNDPALVLADEPTGNLDAAAGRSILDLFGELNAGGTTLVLITHDMDVAVRADRIIEVGDGRIVAGEPDGSAGPRRKQPGRKQTSRKRARR